MRVSYCRLISASLLLLAVPAFALAGPRSTLSRLHAAHASLKHTSGKRKAVPPVAVRHEAEHHEAEHHEAAHHEMAAVEMPSERATQIQAALISQGYLTGEPTGTWDAQTASAMQKLQAENGWQSKITPDSRALIKLGLGPQTPGPDPDQSNNIAQTQQQ
jgi:hypothetical protein